MGRLMVGPPRDVERFTVVARFLHFGGKPQTLFQPTQQVSGFTDS